MSSGAKVVSHIIPEVTPGVTPAGTWDTLRLTGNALTPTVNTQVSDEITDTRLSQGSVATSIDIGGDLTAEFSFASFDQLLEAAFYGNWTGNVLSVGDTRHTFSIAKGYDDVGVYGVFKGAHVSTFALDIPSDGKITATFNMACLDYADSETPIVVSPNAPTTTPFLSNNNVGTILVNGQSLEGVACVSAMTVNLDNSLQAQRCLGSDSLGPGAHIATEAAITGSITLAWSKRAWEIWKNTFTRAPIGVVFPITDSLGNKYTFNFPAVEVDGELPNGGKRDLIEVTLNYTVAKVSPTITRVPFVPVTSVSVAPTTASIAVAATRQLTASALPAEAAQNVTWTSSAPSVATVSSSGLVTGVTAGSATITATSVSDVTKTSTAAITVTA
ncbi:Bacterial surface proteins containing Ig-like domains [Pseudomonas sp. LAMO17WK12:I6]|uniref:phage tail tube protein n=1 Tax=unclassified Pseudomonas TaxID=196821 RepID=UPI000BD12280|nr:MULTISPECIES: phage tail tube protein [unclassified Pseudomonas]SNY42403.1 Bacterial surface proteins containing Ig-like domains [Pseudomonas sp. LAMO17WK12:I6]SNY43667.1 Bacterial surface proteins containing Ig-like domains [Pseudomonas sp. LAMO17WK12:I5]